MSDLENRIKKLEQRPEAAKPRATIVYVVTRRLTWDGDINTLSEAQKAHREAAEVNIKAAIAEYKSKHPDWEPSPRDLYIEVMDAETKEITERLIAGEGTGAGD